MKAGQGQSICWRQAYPIVGPKPPTVCPDGTLQDGDICFTPCKDGYTGNFSLCLQNCPDGFRDTGADCVKPEQYGRGVGYIDFDTCQSENAQGCEVNGLLYYPKCNEGFYAFGCCICLPTCIAGMTDIGEVCQKNTYDRGDETPLMCASGYIQEGDSCFTKCNNGFTDSGICWVNCPIGYSACGGDLCVKNTACGTALMNIATTTTSRIVEIISLSSELPDGPIETIPGVNEVLSAYDYPICTNRRPTKVR
jgi:hypothetical protein